jgi:SsrA-binding protein
MPKKKRIQSKSIKNRRAKYDYELGDSLVVGLQLSGAETKSLRMAHGHLRGAYVTVKDGELWLINATVTGSSGIPIGEEEQTRSRKLLAKRKETDKLIALKKDGMSIVPLEILNKGRFIKLRISLGKGKKRYDKRQVLKARDEKRQIDRAIAHK